MPEPRLNTNQEVFDLLTRVGILRDAATSPATAATDAAIAAAVTTIPVDDETGFTQGMLIRIGAGDLLEENVVESAAAGELTVRIPTAYAHATGTAVVQRERIIPGEPSDAGAISRANAELQEVRVATKRRPYLRRVIGMTSELEFTVVNFNLSNIAAAAGVPESSVTGTGVAATPYALRLLDTLIASEQNVSLFAQGVRQDGTTYEVQGWAVDMDPSNEITLSSGEGSGNIRFNGQAKGIQWTSPALP